MAYIKTDKLMDLLAEIVEVVNEEFKTASDELETKQNKASRDFFEGKHLGLYIAKEIIEGRIEREKIKFN